MWIHKCVGQRPTNRVTIPQTLSRVLPLMWTPRAGRGRCLLPSLWAAEPLLPHPLRLLLAFSWSRASLSHRVFHCDLASSNLISFVSTFSSWYLLVGLRLTLPYLLRTCCFYRHESSTAVFPFPLLENWGITEQQANPDLLALPDLVAWWSVWNDPVKGDTATQRPQRERMESPALRDFKKLT